jgi:hypothetical protein
MMAAEARQAAAISYRKIKSAMRSVEQARAAHDHSIALVQETKAKLERLSKMKSAVLKG